MQKDAFVLPNNKQNLVTGNANKISLFSLRRLRMVLK